MKKIQYEKRLSGLRAYIEDHGLTGALITSYEIADISADLQGAAVTFSSRVTTPFS